MHKMHTRLSLVEQSVVSIKEDTSEIKDMLNEHRKDYVTRIEHDKLERRVDTMENRFWAVLIGVLMLIAKEIVNLFAK